MARDEYLCLDCGRQFSLDSKVLRKAQNKSEEKCPYCEGKKIMRINPSSWFGFFGGGG